MSQKKSRGPKPRLNLKRFKFKQPLRGQCRATFLQEFHTLADAAGLVCFTFVFHADVAAVAMGQHDAHHAHVIDAEVVAFVIKLFALGADGLGIPINACSDTGC